MEPTRRLPRFLCMRVPSPLLAAFLLLASSLSSPLSAQGVQVCRIVSVDTVAMNFVCQTNNTMRQYWASRATRFATPGPTGSFFDLKTGQRVQVVSHRSGKLQIADLVS